MNNGPLIVGRLLWATCYVGLLLMFAYTSLCDRVFLKGNVGFLEMYNIVQSTWSGFVVNVGLLLMLLVDYCYDKPNIPSKMLLLSILAFGILSLVFYFAGHTNVVHEFNRPFKWPWFGMLLYCVFVIYLMIVKFLSFPSVKNNEIKETY